MLILEHAMIFEKDTPFKITISSILKMLVSFSIFYVFFSQAILFSLCDPLKMLRSDKNLR